MNDKITAVFKCLVLMGGKESVSWVIEPHMVEQNHASGKE